MWGGGRAHRHGVKLRTTVTWGSQGAHRNRQAARSWSSGQNLSLSKMVGNPGQGSPPPCWGLDPGHPLLANLLNQKLTRGAFVRWRSNHREPRRQAGAQCGKTTSATPRETWRMGAAAPLPSAGQARWLHLTLHLGQSVGSWLFQYFFMGGSLAGEPVPKEASNGCG